MKLHDNKNNLSKRILNVFEREGIETTEQLKELSKKDILNLKNIGYKSYFHISEFIENM